MLFRQRFLEGIAAGAVTLAFRRWKRPTVKAGGTLRTPIGVLAIETVDEVAERALSETDARRAGFASLAELRAELARAPGGGGAERRLYRIAFRLAGPDPREALRRSDRLETAELAELRARLDRLDARSPRGAWTGAVLRAIRDRPATRAAELAAALGRERDAFKVDVRKLKALGLTESLEVGYRLSRRGAAFLACEGRS